MNTFISGAMTMGYLIAGLFFLRYWSRSRDVLFSYFAASFWLLAVQRIALAFTAERFENSTGIYLMRLLAFVLIIVAILQKNRSRNGF